MSGAESVAAVVVAEKEEQEEEKKAEETECALGSECQADKSARDSLFWTLPCQHKIHSTCIYVAVLWKKGRIPACPRCGDDQLNGMIGVCLSARDVAKGNVRGKTKPKKTAVTTPLKHADMEMAERLQEAKEKVDQQQTAAPKQEQQQQAAVAQAPVKLEEVDKPDELDLKMPRAMGRRSAGPRLTSRRYREAVNQRMHHQYFRTVGEMHRLQLTNARMADQTYFGGRASRLSDD